MRTSKLSDYKRGWIIGNFDPSILNLKDVEVGIQEYKSGEIHEEHHHKLATEINVVIKGKCLVYLRSNNQDKSYIENVFSSGDIFIVEPNESIQFESKEDCIILCIKYPSVQGDKYS